MAIMNLENHIALTSAPLMKEICKPLEPLGITYFSFVRTYNDNSHIRLSNNPEWTNHYYQREFYNVVLKQVPDAEGNLLWSNIDKYPLFYEASVHFDVDNGTVVVYRFEDIVERYFFGSNKRNREVINIYIHQFDVLKVFINYFKAKAEHLIREAEKAKIILPGIDNKISDNYCDDLLIEQFLKETYTKRISLRCDGEDILVSRNEAKILSLKKNGYTAKEIAKRINLSPKTIEIYSDRLKSKFGLHSSSSLISFARKYSLLDDRIL